MKITRRIVLAMFAAMIAFPIVAFAAKADRSERKKAAAPADFATIDKDGNGSISEAEYVAAMKEKQTEATAKSQFATLDKDHDGKLSKDELAASAAKKKRKKKDSN